ncbi:MAG: DUF1343 domain-containing protein [Reichenbachiella sp.]|uniref:exo-beta-N-acetylmuramidase NamZ family protein n=1 Tax=Reichenbachiella sp. TaxID=2184521 RepID=UPI0032639D4F
MLRIIKYFNRIIVALVFLIQFGCLAQSSDQPKIITGAEQLDQILPVLNGKSVALLVNHTSMIGQTHLLDTLLSHNVSIKTVFAPEHGFRGDLANGEKVFDETDQVTGLPIVSLYGKKVKPTAKQLEGIDIVVFDIQDAGVRFYTYISSMHYMMEACAEQNIEFMILDRPNPNAHYIDGPVMEPQYTSFVGLHPIPIVYGTTLAELARMIKGEGWIDTADQLKLKIIPLKNWTHQTPYSLPIKPSPNLPNEQSIALYPTLGLFEGTNVSMGRGTPFPFQVIGFPDSTFGNFEFIPRSIPEASKYPKHEDRVCFGQDLRAIKASSGIDLNYLLTFYQKSSAKEEFFNSFFTNLAGTKRLRRQIEDGLTEDEIKASWQDDLTAYKELRLKYLLY